MTKKLFFLNNDISAKKEIVIFNAPTLTVNATRWRLHETCIKLSTFFVNVWYSQAPSHDAVLFVSFTVNAQLARFRAPERPLLTARF